MPENEKPQRKKRRKYGLLILSVIVTAILCAVVLSVVLRVEGYAHGYGNVAAHLDPLLRASQKGPIAEILAKNDQRVTAGQLIIRLDDSLARVTLQRAQMDAEEAADQIEVFQAECKLALAQRQFQRDKAQLQITSAKHYLDQLLAGKAKGTVSAVEVAEAQLDYNLVALQPEQTYEAQEQRERQELALLRQQLLAARAQAALCEQQLANLQVCSPIAGRVVLNPLVVGEVVDANKVLGRVFDESSFTIQAKFPERLIYLLKQGQQADIWLAGRSRWGQPLVGQVMRIGRLVQPQDTGDGYFWIAISVDPRDLQLYPGQDARVSVHVGKVTIFRYIAGL